MNVKGVGKLVYSKEKEEQKNEELITRKKVKDSPFEVIGLVEKKEYFATLGEYRITEVYNTEKKAVDQVKKMNWNRVIQVVMILIEKLNKK